MIESNDQQQNLEESDNSEMVDVLSDLDDFNSPSSEELQDEVNESSPEETKENIAEAKNWLIDNKFEDTEEGRKKLVDSYKNLQSKYDKEKPGKEMERLQKLDIFLKENPNVVAAMKGEVSKMQQSLTGPPPKPENYDSYDEDIEGTVSYQWRQDYNKYLVDQGRNAARSEVDALRHEIKQERDSKDRISKLKAMGMSNDEIKEYDAFMSDDRNVSEENLVEIFRFLKAKETGKPVPATPKRTSAAAVSGAIPPQGKTSDKERDEFFKGLMKFSR
tara:strand:+ start:63 stop:887 length:825 start_codon:yes stop_codon:yes gene_type:complete